MSEAVSVSSGCLGLLLKWYSTSVVVFRSPREHDKPNSLIYVIHFSDDRHLVRSQIVISVIVMTVAMILVIWKV